ncbi:MAG: hypothetical protein QM755_08765 [Luteolibacter sp.]
MSGTPSSDLPKLACGLVAWLCATLAGADEIEMQGSSKLSGKVVAMNANGSVQIESPMAAEPLDLRPGVVKRVLFTDAKDIPMPGSTRLTLVNGDVLPCELKSLDAQTMTVSTSFAGDIKVPRTIITSMDLGVHDAKTLYEGPAGLDGWTNDKWKALENRFFCTGSAKMSRSFDLPAQYSLRFTLSWRGNPNFQTTFGDVPDSDSPTMSRYAFLFNNGGIELRRLGGSRASTTLIQLSKDRSPDSFPNSKMDVEIRVDRTQATLWLLIDGVVEGRRADPIKEPPAGGGLSFSSNAGGDTEVTLTNLRLLSWDADGDRHRTEERGAPGSDTLILAEGDRYSGELEEIHPGADGKAILSFKSPVLEQPMNIPARKVSTVFFKDPPKGDAAAPSPFLVKLQGGGSVQADGCTFLRNQHRHPACQARNPDAQALGGGLHRADANLQHFRGMKSSTFLPLLLLGAHHAAASPSGTIQLANRDQLGGELSSIGKDRIVWTSPLLEKQAPFFLNKVKELNLPTTTPDSAASYDAVIALTNGDTLRGQLASVTDKAVELDTWYAGRVAVSRPMVQSVKIEDHPKLLFRGPDSLDGWTGENSRKDAPSAWSFEGGALQSHGLGTIAREVNLPDVCRMAFSIEWNSALNLTYRFAVEGAAKVNPPNCYELTMQRRFVSLKKRFAGSQQPNAGFQSQNVPEFNENEKARLEIYMDRKKGIFNLVVDGRSVVVWNDQNPNEQPTGGGIQFITGDLNPVRISRIEVSAWDGVVEQQPETEDLLGAEQQDNEAKEAKVKEAESGRMMLRNGDSMAGEVLSILNGIMKVKTRFGEIDLPVSRLKNIALKPVELEAPKIREGDIRAWFPDGGRVVFRLDSATVDTLTGFSQNFGTVTFKTSAFNRIEFNLYDPAFMEMRGEKAW